MQISDEAVEAAARAIKRVMDLREGPFGLYDYTSYGNPKPHVVRDFRPSAEKYGAWLFQSTDRDEALREYTRLTDAYLGRAALEAALPHLLASQGCGTGHSGEQLEPAVGATAALASDVVRLVIAARNVAFEDHPEPSALRELDAASEPFANRVPWVDEPNLTKEA